MRMWGYEAIKKWFVLFVAPILSIFLLVVIVPMFMGYITPLLIGMVYGVEDGLI